MCDLTAGFTTVTGAGGDLAEIAASWDQTVRLPFETAKPELRSLGAYDSRYADPRCPAVLVVQHDELLGSRVADRINRAIRRSHPYVDVIAEPGYYLQPVGGYPAPAGGVGGGGVSVTLANLSRVTVHAPAAANPGGHSVAVIDTGDAAPNATVIDFTQSNGPQGCPPVDCIGHGSAVAELIRSYNGLASVESLRVCTTGLAVSTELFLALTYALWLDARYDVVNVSMSTQLVGKCETQVGLTIDSIAEWCQTHRTTMGGQLVTAAGNLPQKFGYPAAVDGAVIVEALDWQPAPASYNTAVPAGTATSQASGGESSPGQTLGSVTANGTTTDLVGTSFAAALVSAELTR